MFETEAKNVRLREDVFCELAQSCILLLYPRVIPPTTER